jgi:hypothetical protein
MELRRACATLSCLSRHPLLDRAALADLVGILRRQAAAASRTKEDGRVRALVAWPPDRWMLWDQNERPRLVQMEIETRRPIFTLSRDGSQVLIMGNLTATGWVCEFGRNCQAVCCTCFHGRRPRPAAISDAWLGKPIFWLLARRWTGLTDRRFDDGSSE